MKKNLFFAALAAVALTMGFASCSNDDDNTSAYDETYIVRFDNHNSGSNEYNIIAEAYRSALGITDTIASTVIVSGKDQADCDSIFKQKLKKVDNKLSAMTWDETTWVNGFRKKNSENLFRIIYEPVDNDIRDVLLGQDSAYVNHITELGEYGNDYLPEVQFLDYLGSFPLLADRYWDFLRKSFNRTGLYTYYRNVNECNTGNYVPLFIGKEKDQQKPLTDVIAIRNNNGETPKSVVFEGRTYKMDDDAVSLNDGNINAPQIYLYYTTDDIDGSAICYHGVKVFYSAKKITTVWMKQQSILFWWRDLGEHSTYVEKDVVGFPHDAYADCLVDLVTRGMNPHVLQYYIYNASNKQLKHVGPCCLNEGAGGHNLYLCWGTKEVSEN